MTIIAQAGIPGHGDNPLALEAVLCYLIRAEGNLSVHLYFFFHNFTPAGEVVFIGRLPLLLYIGLQSCPFYGILFLLDSCVGLGNGLRQTDAR